MYFRKTWKLNRIETCHVSPIAPEQPRQNISAIAITCEAWWTRIPAADNPELGKRRRASEVFIGVNIDLCRMIDCDEPHLIEIDEFLHDLGKPKAQPSITGLYKTAFDAQIFGRIRNIRFARRDPVTDDAWADHVGDEFVVFAVPNPHDRARAAPPVDFTNEVTAGRCKLNLILHDTGRPQKSHDVSFTRLIEARDDFPRILSQISRR